jgi:hypothetical protein
MATKRFKKLADGWKDATTGLTWSPTSKQCMDWTAAQEWAATLGKGWRLPTIKELLTLVEYERFSPATDCPDTVSSLYWSASTYQDGPSNAWYVNFFGGSVYAYNKTDSYYARAVRGGS